LTAAVAVVAAAVAPASVVVAVAAAAAANRASTAVAVAEAAAARAGVAAVVMAADAGAIARPGRFAARSCAPHPSTGDGPASWPGRFILPAVVMLTRSTADLSAARSSPQRHGCADATSGLCLGNRWSMSAGAADPAESHAVRG
jgi:hypothetical protein